MPSPSRKIGDKGEDLVVDMLKENGYNIIARNWYCRWGELDIVAQDLTANGQFVFIEVKTRRNVGVDETLTSITAKKMTKVYHSAYTFIQERSLGDIDYRFDAIAVSLNTLEPTFRHEKNIEI